MKLRRWFDLLFPEVDIYPQHWPWRQQALFFLALTLVFSLLGMLLPPTGDLGFDWVNVFAPGRLPPFYPPWSAWVISWLSWPLLIGLSMGAIGLAVTRRAAHPASAAVALLALPVMWTLFLGQLEGLVVLGLLGLPWLPPLALLKPQVSLFAFGARKAYLAAGLVWLALSLLIWGPWVRQMLAVNSYYAEGRYLQDISLGWWGALLALPLFWFSRGDMDMLMLSGAWMTPHLIPYNMLPFTPAIARLKPGPAIVAALLSWLPLTANWLGKAGWWLGWVYVAWLWGWLAYERYKPGNKP